MTAVESATAPNTPPCISTILSAARWLPLSVAPVQSDDAETILARTWRPALSVTGVAGMPPLGMAGNVLRPQTAVKLSMRVPPTCDVVKAGGPTVKNVSGFDLCRLLVGARGALGFIGDVILRTRPLAAASQWFTVAASEPFAVFGRLFRPVSVLWNGRQVWTLLEGHPDDVRQQAAAVGLNPCDGPPPLLAASRVSVPPNEVARLSGDFVVEVGVGVVHSGVHRPSPGRDDRARTLALAVKAEFDPTGRLNPGVDV